jgi:hypothetical protein
MKALAAAFFFLSAAPLFAQDEHIGFRVREWYARMSGTVEGTKQGVGSSTIDLTDDLGLGDQNLTTELQLYVRIPVVGRIYAGWWRAHDSGSSVLSRSIDFEGESFTASTPVNTEVTLSTAYLTYEFAFPTIPVPGLGKVELAASLGVHGFHGEGSVSGAGLNAKGDGKIGLPTLGAHVTVEMFEWLRAEAEVQGLAFSYGDNEAHYLEGSVEVVAEPLPWLFAGLGYKYVAFNARHDGSDSFHVNVDIAGFFLTAGVRF